MKIFCVLAVVLLGIALFYLCKYKFLFVYSLKTPEKLKDTYDYIVVGSGSAGAVVAARLSEDPDVSVLLIEAGTDGSEIPYSHIAGLAPFNQLTSIDWQYLTEPQKQACLSLKNQQSRWPRGKVLGGSSVLNYMVFVRCSPRDYDYWAEYAGASGWSYRNLLTYFKKIESITFDTPHSNYRGKSGPVKLTKPGTLIGDAILEAAQERGYPMSTDYNGPKSLGFARFQHSAFKGWRMSTAAAYLYPNSHRENLDILTGSLVTDVQINDNKEATGVDFVNNGQKYSANADQEVIVSAGAVGSPQLLLLSGIGPKDQLQDLNVLSIDLLTVKRRIGLQIPVVVDSPMLGKHLQDHVMVLFLMTVNQSIGYDFAPLVSLTSVKRMLEWAIFGTGPISWSNMEINAFLHSNVDEQLRSTPDLQIFAFPADLYQNGHLAELVNYSPEVVDSLYVNRNDRSVIAMGAGLQQPMSMGEIRLRSADPMEHPIIEPNYLSSERDVKVLIKGCKIIFDLLESKAAKKLDLKPAEGRLSSCSEHKIWSDAYFECIIRHKTLTIYHSTSTCRLGPDPKSSVVDPLLRVHGIKKLRVADASVFPRITSGNTNVPAMMIGEKVADLIKRTTTNSSSAQKTPVKNNLSSIKCIILQIKILQMSSK